MQASKLPIAARIGRWARAALDWLREMDGRHNLWNGRPGVEASKHH